MTLPDAVAVPVGFAVAHEDERRHGRYASSPWIWDSQDGRASSPARRAASAARSRRSSSRRAPGSRHAAAGLRPAIGEALAHRHAICRSLASRSGPSRRLSASLGGLDVLVNNAGIARQARFEEVADDEWDAYWQLNVMSYVRAIRAASAASSGGDRAGDRQRLLDGRQAAVDGHAPLLGDEGCRAVTFAAGRRSVRQGRHPLQRRDARADRDRRLARRGRARRPAGATARRCSPRSAPAGRSAGSRPPTRSPR